ncbi:mitochondrial 54S ribosomal protein YmL41 [Coemansia sp. RSA 2706]|nr:mitochondrial 54S ribosomal protein YmL41 [Coemansia sp. RSA 2711]KAJ2299489.1 mitochondrial 54S ribosomal protein YmL41 [Coemansia sp. RSA 2706]KAJ2304465.1 mitochondrial 54S ribosomal protein YmL41 [Coemansia sp. RSA 2705]KAJ2316130.1 mitochondrial 54S ribosomal protein YmL41 [Coemansia sp. RSA 2704]KAJ2369446.1 mitochondrial 54S ribosomal protein YmL41 [Coemansia sp. RSA 2610]KAJ2392121.1 mitochondrial 54S ribosomal protein YmL41 [Coemansia sp. RSA 2611]KAJ2718796.1 mitochondrial 54S ri
MAPKFGNLRIYFPNIIFKIIPDARLGKNQAAFRVPLNINKLDIRDYLTHIYNVTVTDVRTAVLPGKLFVNRYTGQKERTSRTKKAIVTMKEEFAYPAEPDVENDLGGKESRFEKMRTKSRTKGWNYRPPLEMKELRQEIMAKRTQTDQSST